MTVSTNAMFLNSIQYFAVFFFFFCSKVNDFIFINAKEWIDFNFVNIYQNCIKICAHLRRNTTFLCDNFATRFTLIW